MSQHCPHRATPRLAAGFTQRRTLAARELHEQQAAFLFTCDCQSRTLESVQLAWSWTVCWCKSPEVKRIEY
jgi:hypothetical protein